MLSKSVQKRNFLPNSLPTISHLSFQFKCSVKFVWPQLSPLLDLLPLPRVSISLQSSSAQRRPAAGSPPPGRGGDTNTPPVGARSPRHHHHHRHHHHYHHYHQHYHNHHCEVKPNVTGLLMYLDYFSMRSTWTIDAKLLQVIWVIWRLDVNMLILL